MAKIFIDAGHGGHDPGALGSKSNEKSNVLKVALKLKTLLEQSGHRVKLSRSTDVYLTLNERARLANAWGADYFISLHNNSAKSNAATGFETFVHNGPLQSKTLEYQKAVHDAIAINIGISNRGKKRANYAVLRLTRMPAVLIEYAFINNPKDESILINQVDNLALWTAQGINKMAGGSLPAVPKPTPIPEEKEVDELTQYMDEKLPPTQQKDAEDLFKLAYADKHFSVDHSPKVKNMTRREFHDLKLSLEIREKLNKKVK